MTATVLQFPHCPRPKKDGAAAQPRPCEVITPAAWHRQTPLLDAVDRVVIAAIQTVSPPPGGASA